MIIDFSPFFDLQTGMDKLFDEFGKRTALDKSGESYPLVNVSEDDANVYVRAALPGVAASDIELTLGEESLRIQGERRVLKGVFFRQERQAGLFLRKVALGRRVQREKVTAVFSLGVLTVVLPKSSPPRPMRIPVQPV